MRIKLLLLSSLIYSSSTYAIEYTQKSNIKIVKNYKGESGVYLKGQSCASLKEEAENIRQWAASIGESTTEKVRCDCNAIAKTNCVLDVKGIAPKILKQFQFKRPDISGPNCWNTSLVAAKILPHARYTTPEEMNYWMNSPLCKERDSMDEVRPGDVIAIRDKANGEVHGFTYLSNKMAFSKNGFHRSSPYTLQDTKGVFDVYGVAPECQKITGTSDSCKMRGNIYKCESWDSFWEKNKKHMSKDSSVDKVIDQMACYTSSVLFNADKKSIKGMGVVTDTIDAIQELALSNLNEASTVSEAEKIYWERAQYRVAALKVQIEDIIFSPY